MAVKRSKAASAGQKRGGSTPATGALDFTWTLAELPTSQHRAGLAGLVLMARWLARQPKRKGTCEIVRLDAVGATLRIDATGMKELFDVTYAAAKVELAVPTLRKNARTKEVVPPLRSEERTETDSRTGKQKVKTYHVYEVTVPAGAWLSDVDPTPSPGAYVKLWRDMTWAIVRAIPKTRTPYDARADAEETDDWSEWWSALTGKPDAGRPQKSHFLLGAMEASAECVPFEDRGRFQFLLHFWAFVTMVYEVRDRDVKGKEEHVGYTLAVPDVADLEAFCEELWPAMRMRGSELRGIRPRDAVLSLPAESGLDFLRCLAARLATVEGSKSPSALVVGVDVYFMAKPGQSVAMRGVRRIHPEPAMIDEYASVHDALHDALFRRQRVLNLLDGRSWHDGFVRVLETQPISHTLESRWFRNDCRSAFRHAEERDKENRMSNECRADGVGLELLVHRFVGEYLRRRIEGKYGLRYSGVRDDASRRADFNEKREKIAKDAFYAMRSRSGADFVAYFTETLGSVPQFLRSDEYVALARALHERTDEVRALAMLALSAHSWSPSTKQGSPE